ncbi:unnamed protein product, partial [Ectocarpus sp. 12 AP-2014]
RISTPQRNTGHAHSPTLNALDPGKLQATSAVIESVVRKNGLPPETISYTHSSRGSKIRGWCDKGPRPSYIGAHSPTGTRRYRTGRRVRDNRCRLSCIGAPSFNKVSSYIGVTTVYDDQLPRGDGTAVSSSP